MGNATRDRRGTSAGRSSSRWKAIVAQFKAEGPHFCWICSEPIDMTLHHNDRMSFTLDHIIPMADPRCDPEDVANLRVAHRSCNSRRGATMQAHGYDLPKRSRTW